MRQVLASLGGYLLLSAALSAAPCTPSSTVLCLNDSRFEVEVSWRDSRARTGVGQAKSITADTGYFWFFSEANIELVIKVLDARSINQKYWVFFGALTSVEFDLSVTDTVTGAVKTYHNPLGQFASVGDTGAFDPSITAPTHEIVSSEGTSTPPESLASIQKFIEAQASEAGAAFTPCVDTGAALYLANCRFRLEVHWSDSRGRHGAGHPVQLTNDTGYFWFFSESNVELMVKVLDAKGINDRFWVFFGALSSVEYTINVFDTVSGSLRSYNNPQGAFASVGDTSAFRGGYAISTQTDDPRAVSGPVFAATGGSLSATAADGTVFTLNVPPNSLDEDETVTMTPIGSVGQFPFAGGLVAGVDIQPTGVVLLEGATLSIHTPAPLARSEETPVAWNGSGEDFFLFPPWPTAGDLKLEIFHFGGYGVARGTAAERQTQLGQQPVADGDLLSHELAPLLGEARAAAALNGEIRAQEDRGHGQGAPRCGIPGSQNPGGACQRRAGSRRRPHLRYEPLGTRGPHCPRGAHGDRLSRPNRRNPLSLEENDLAGVVEDPRALLGGPERHPPDQTDHQSRQKKRPDSGATGRDRPRASVRDVQAQVRLVDLGDRGAIQ